MAVRVEVQLVGFLQEIAEKKNVLLDFDGSVCVNDIILKLTNLFPPEAKQVLIDPELNDPRPNVLVLLNKVEISALDGLKTRVKNGAKLVLIPISHGG